MLGAHYCSQAKVESLIGCLPSQKGGARRGAVQVPPGIITYVEQAKENMRRGAEAPASTEKLNLSYVTVEVERRLTMEARMTGPEVPVYGEGGLNEDEPTVERVTVKPRWKAYKASYADLKDLPRLMYTGVIFDCVYLLDKEKSPDALTKPELQKFMEDFDAKTASPCWTIAVFCGFAQQNDFLEAIDGRLLLGARRALFLAQAKLPYESKQGGEVQRHRGGGVGIPHEVRQSRGLGRGGRAASGLDEELRLGE